MSGAVSDEWDPFKDRFKEDAMKKVTKRAKAWIIVLICAVAAVLVAVPIVQARFYWGDEPVFMGNPGMQQLIYHGSDIVMLPEKRENISSNLAYAHVQREYLRGRPPYGLVF